jgi:hypothetical protein
VYVWCIATGGFGGLLVGGVLADHRENGIGVRVVRSRYGLEGGGFPADSTARVTYQDEGVAMIGEDGAQPVMFQQITEYHAPRWPDPAYPQQFHLDVTVDNADAAEAAVLKLGGRIPGRHQGGGAQCTAGAVMPA